MILRITFLTLLLVFASSASAQDNLEQLYGITRDGRLVAIDKMTGQGVVVKTHPSAYTGFDSLTFANGNFYASYAGGKILKFGFVNGDQVDLGYSGQPVVEGLSTRPDGRVFAVLSRNTGDSWNDDGRSESLGELNLSTGQIAVVAQPANATTTGVGASFEAIAHTDNTNFLTIHQNGGFYEKPECYLLPMTSSSAYFSPGGSLPAGPFINWGLLTGLVYDSGTSSLNLFGVTGYEPHPTTFVRQEVPSKLYKLVFTPPNLTYQIVGNVGVNGLTGLTLGPSDCDFYRLNGQMHCL